MRADRAKRLSRVGDCWRRVDRAGWMEWSGDGDWDLYWKTAAMSQVRAVPHFSRPAGALSGGPGQDELASCRPHQRLNHFDRTTAITEKVLLDACTLRHARKHALRAHPRGTTSTSLFRGLTALPSAWQDNLLRNLRRMRALFPRLFDFFPQSFIVPREHAALAAAHDKRRQEEGDDKARALCRLALMPTASAADAYRRAVRRPA
jgi:hypothetical protein